MIDTMAVAAGRTGLLVTVVLLAGDWVDQRFFAVTQFHLHI